MFINDHLSKFEEFKRTDKVDFIKRCIERFFGFDYIKKDYANIRYDEYKKNNSSKIPDILIRIRELMDKYVVSSIRRETKNFNPNCVKHNVNQEFISERLVNEDIEREASDIIKKCGLFKEPEFKKFKDNEDRFYENNPHKFRYDENERILSRYPLHPIKSLYEFNNIVAISCIYLLRGHCKFWTTESLEIESEYNRSFNALKDFRQAGFFIWRLREKYSEVNEIKKKEKIMTEKREIISKLSIIVEVFNGNIMRRVNRDEEALDCYFKSLRSFDNEFTPNIMNKNIQKNYKKDIKNICLTMIKVKQEMGKIFFDKGCFIESLKYHLRATYEILLLCNKDKTYEKINEFRNDILELFEYLDRIKDNRFFNKSDLRDYFLSNAVTADRIKTLITGSGKETLYRLSADILSRIGYVLFSVRCQDLRYDHLDDNKIELKEEYIIPFFEPVGGMESDFGMYCRSIVTPRISGTAFQNEPMRATAFYILKTLGKLNIDEVRNALNGENDVNDKTLLKNLCFHLGRASLYDINNLFTIPERNIRLLVRQGYLKRRKKKINKLVILRRWQSYNPKLPCAIGKNLKGGGYFLIWNDKGIVIDPGYDFIQNFYDEGFSLEDIHAVVLTHSHPDHDDELSSLLTLLHEWNTYYEKTLQSEKKTFDLFLNESTYRKYENWIYAKEMKVVRKVTLLQNNIKGFGRKGKPERLGNNPIINLQDRYNMDIEVVPALHNDILGENVSIGLIFKLKNENREEICSVGFTGDTGKYEGIEEKYKLCNILVAHLGDVKIAEIAAQHEVSYLRAILMNMEPPKNTKIKDFIKLAAILDMVEWESDKFNEFKINIETKKCSVEDEWEKFESYSENDKKKPLVDSIWLGEYNYKYHLGVQGVYHLFKEMKKQCETDKRVKTRLFLIGEIPEELGSYRQYIARYLRWIGGDKVHSFTADIGLHVKLPKNKGDDPKIRCFSCFHNYELSLKDDENHYHHPNCIQETILKQHNFGMIYLCRKYEHASLPIERPDIHLADPLCIVNPPFYR